jgi:hypothetical protein
MSCLPTLDITLPTINLPAFPPKIKLPQIKISFELPCPLALAGGVAIITVGVG